MALTLANRNLAWCTEALLLVSLPGLDPSQPLTWLLLVLVVAAALKLLEARRSGERRLVALVQVLAIGLLATLRSDLAGSLLQLAALMAAIAALVALDGPAASAQQLLRRSISLMLAALPLALLPFVLLPRLEPFGQRRGLFPGATARTGLSDNLEPGAIGRLASEDAPAARVVFVTAPPPPAQRYWRVLVHEQFDGRRWRSGSPAAPLQTAAGRVSQLWLVEPSPLLALPWDGRGAPAAAQPDLQTTRRGELRSRQPLMQRRHYRLAQSSVAGGAAWRHQPPSALNLSLPRGGDPRLEALGATWAELPTPERRLEAAEAWFRRQPFRYSLSPGTLPQRGGLDAFLFERRVGFCGHYASAFTALMRAAGVPARVVSGYRGGSWVRSLGGSAYLDLRQSDAHAWSEVWLPQQGWVRVDPTLWINTVSLSPPQPPALLTWWQRQWWGLDVAWTRWWLGFDRQEQELLLRRWLGDRRSLVGWLLLALMGALLPLLLMLLRLGSDREGGDPGRRLLMRSLLPLASLGLAPAPGETLAAFGVRVVTARPELAPSLVALVGSYDRLRFAPLSPARRRARWQRLRWASRRLRRAVATSHPPTSDCD